MPSAGARPFLSAASSSAIRSVACTAVNLSTMGVLTAARCWGWGRVRVCGSHGWLGVGLHLRGAIGVKPDPWFPPVGLVPPVSRHLLQQLQADALRIAGHQLGPRPVGRVRYFDPDSATAVLSPQMDPALVVAIEDAVCDELGDQQGKHADLLLTEHCVERFHGAAGTPRRTGITLKRFVDHVALFSMGGCVWLARRGRRRLALWGTPG